MSLFEDIRNVQKWYRFKFESAFEKTENEGE